MLVSATARIRSALRSDRLDFGLDLFFGQGREREGGKAVSGGEQAIYPASPQLAAQEHLQRAGLQETDGLRLSGLPI
jgi:hypothetical protein